MQNFFNDETKLAPAQVDVIPLDGGGFIMRSPQKLKPYARCIGDCLEHWAVETPDAVYLAEREGDGWRELTYRQVRALIGKLAQGLLNLGRCSKQPLVVLSENDLNHALLTLAAMHVGIPVGTISVAYSKGRDDYSRLQQILTVLNPGAIFVSNGSDYVDSLLSIDIDCPVIVGQTSESLPRAVRIDELYAVTETAAVKEAFANLTPEHTARYLFTSGSTDDPKIVVNSHRMLCSNQQMIAQCWRFLEQSKPVVVDWLPWSHTFGANHNFNLVLRNGGSFYIDDGVPVAGKIERTVENIKMVRPSMYFNVPRGYDMLLPFLETDEEFARALLGNLDALFYAAAALPMSTWKKIHEIAKKVRDTPLFFTSEWGATETSPVLTNVHFPTEKPGNLGLPVPGIEIKFVPSADKLEMRVKGPSVFSRYLDNDERSEELFDEDGFYKIGGAGYLLDEEHPEQAIVLAGRVSEDFKLTTGTWVSVGTLRPAVVSALAPYVSDCVICGHDRNEIGVLAFPTDKLWALAGSSASQYSADQLTLIPAVRQTLLKALKQMQAENRASSRHVARLLLLDTPPCRESGELTDKGYLNQRIALTKRADQVTRLYVNAQDPAVICVYEELEEIKEEG